MSDLLPCRFCGTAPNAAISVVPAADRHYVRHVCMGPYHTTIETAAAEWNAANAAPDPALLALAKLGAWALDHDDIYDSDRRAAGALMMDGCAPGDVSALAARLLAPDGADGAGEVPIAESTSWAAWNAAFPHIDVAHAPGEE